MNRVNSILSVSVIILSLYLAPPLNAEVHPPDEILIYNASGGISAVPEKAAAGIIAVEIRDGLYIYANPKGPGIGKATEVSIENSRFIKSREARYPEGEKYQAKGDTSPVYIYRKSVRLPFAFVVKKDTAEGVYPVKVKVSVLICSDSACIPVEKTVEIAVKVQRGASAGSELMTKNLSEFLSTRKTADAGSVLIDISPSEGDGISGTGNGGIPESIKFKPHYPDGEITGIVRAILFGLIAGFLLNFMPCVLPVVSLKIMSFIMNAGEKKRVIVIQGFLFSAGIIASFLVLAALAAFSGYKWGALFQEKVFLVAMASFIFSMALSLFGVFTFNVPFLAAKAVSKTHGIYRDAFIKGAVATLLATPCSGPFLGGTLAWTFTRPPEIIFIIFMSVGFGMALPYILLVLNPSLLRVLPEPGEWMNHFEKAMGFLLMFTVVYLLGILDNTSRMGLILFLLVLSIALWQFGTFGSLEKERWKRIVSFTVMVSLILTGYLLSFRCLFNDKDYSHERTGFNAEKILNNRERGIVTVVEFTADWCPNCSMVEKVALGRERVKELFARDDIEFMVADITKKNSEAEFLMSRLGSRSIPLLAVFPPGEGFSSPFCLRDIYSADDVAEAVGNAVKFIQK